MRPLIAVFFLIAPLAAADRFTGLQSCASSSCHGGGKGDDQLAIWIKKDPHSRADSILSAERSRRIAEALGISDATKSAQCTVCHSPQHSAAPERFMADVKPARGVSCESCHGPAEKWLRFHTRTDVTHTQRIAAGLRALDTPAQRASACAGCHLHLPPELQKARHPELRFELARQLAGLPPHWHGDDEWDAPASWIAGQAVSLRELAWRQEKSPDDATAARIAALLWILHETPATGELPHDSANPRALRTAADKAAASAHTTRWNSARVHSLVTRLSGHGAMFRDGKTDATMLRRRAEVLAPALRALTLPLQRSEKLEATLTALDEQLRSPVSFEPAQFAKLLEELPALLPPAK